MSVSQPEQIGGRLELLRGHKCERVAIHNRKTWGRYREADKIRGNENTDSTNTFYQLPCTSVHRQARGNWR